MEARLSCIVRIPGGASGPGQRLGETMLEAGQHEQIVTAQDDVG